jgi:predicted Zn-dependent protease
MITPLQQEWTAAYFDGASARRHDVRVRIAAGGLTIVRDGGGDLYWPFEEIRQTQGNYSGEHVRLERGAPIAETLVVANEDFLVALRQVAPNLGQQFHDPKTRSSRWKLTAAAAVAVVVLGSAMYYWGVPAIANLLATLVPVSWEERLGKSTMGLLVSEDDKCDNPDALAALDALVTKLTDGIEDSPYTFRVAIAQDEMVNAFAAPGGYIVVMQGLLKQSETPDQLAGVLAHEMQHIVHRHSTRALFHQISAQALLSILSGDTSATPFGIDGAATLADLHHQRSHEDEADRDGMKLMQAVKANPLGMVEMFNHLKGLDLELPEAIQYLSSHPATDDRIESLEQLAAGADYEPEPLLSDEDWEALQGACRVEEE